MSEPKRRGRPPIDNPRGEILRVRATPDERAAMQAAADAKGQPLAAWMHDVLARAAKRQR